MCQNLTQMSQPAPPILSMSTHPAHQRPDHRREHMLHNNNTVHRLRPWHLRWLAVAAVTAALAVAASTAAAAGAQTDNRGPVDVAVASYAADYSVTHQEAQRRLDRIQPLQDILAEIRSLEEARLAGWGIDHAGVFTGWVWLTGDQPPSTAAASIAEAHSDVEIRTGAAHTYNELRAAQGALFRSSGTARHITDNSGTIESMDLIVTFTGIDMRNNAVRVGIDPSISDPLAISDHALWDKAAEIAQQLKDSITVSFVIGDGRGIASEKSFAGGEHVHVKNGSRSFTCTSGFAARANGEGAYGIITAGHCGDDGPNENSTTLMHEVELPFDYGWASVDADAQFHTIPDGSSHKLRDDYLCEVQQMSAWCDVTDVIARSKMIDDHICHTGRNSGITCGTVTDVSYRPQYSGEHAACVSLGGDGTSCNDVFVEVHGPSLKSCKGDSGGPWYRNGIAYGIHKGSNSNNNCTATGVTAHFSGIRDVEDFLDVQVLTNSTVTIP